MSVILYLHHYVQCGISQLPVITAYDHVGVYASLQIRDIKHLVIIWQFLYLEIW